MDWNTAPSGLARTPSAYDGNNRQRLFPRESAIDDADGTRSILAASHPPRKRDDSTALSRSAIRAASQTRPPLSLFAAKTVHRPSPHPHLCPEFPNPPHNESSEAVDGASRLSRSNGVLAPTTFRRWGVVDWLSHATSSLERSPAAPHSPQRPAQNIATDGTAALVIAAGSNFPEILYRIVSNPSYSHIASWLPHGLGFAIHDRQLFASQILPRHFDGAKRTSFTRRLKRWQFARVQCGPEMGAYYHKHFARGRPDLVRGMVCGMDDDDGETKDEDGQSNEKIVKKKQQRKDEEKKKNEDGLLEVASLDDNVARDDAAFATAMEVHRRQQHQQLKRNMDEEMTMRNDEDQGDQIQKKKMKETKENEKNKPKAFGAAYDAAVAEAAMEVNWQQQWQSSRHLLKKSENVYQENTSNSRNQEMVRHQQEEALPPSVRGSPGPEKLSTPYNSSDCNLPGMSDGTSLDDAWVRQRQQQPRPLGWRSPEESTGSAPKRQRIQSHQAQSSGKSSGLNGPGEFRQYSLTAPFNPEAFSPEAYAPEDNPPTVAARRNDMPPASSLTVGMPTTIRNNGMPANTASQNELLMRLANLRNNGILGTMSTLEGNAFLPRHLNAIYPLDVERQQCFNAIEPQVFSEMSFPTHRAASSSGPLSTSNHSTNDSGDDHVTNYRGDGMGDAVVDRNGMLDKTFMETHQQMNNRHFLAHQEINKKMPATPNTYKEIMMMAARDSQARAGGGQLATASQHQWQQPPLPQEHLQMQWQQQLPPRHTSMQAPFLPSRIQAPPSTPSYPLSQAQMLWKLEEEMANITRLSHNLSAEAADGTKLGM